MRHVLLQELAKDSSKHRAKKDRRQQRACFRDIVRGVEEGEPPNSSINISPAEKLVMDSWQSKVRV